MHHLDLCDKPSTRARARVSAFITHLGLAFRTAQNPLDFVFHLGYQQIILPRWIRRLAAKTKVHKAWLDGFHGWWMGTVLEREAQDL